MENSPRTEVVAAGVPPAVEPGRPARRMGVNFFIVRENFVAQSGRRDARPPCQAGTPGSTMLSHKFLEVIIKPV